MALKQPVIPRFMAKVNQTSACWLWTAWLDKNGYGKFWLAGRNAGAHRVAHQLFIGPIPPGYEVDHLCFVRSCVNPEHLEAVTPSENVRRMVLRRTPYQHKRDRCPNGHEYDTENTSVTPTGRACKTCKADANRAYYERNRELTIQRAREWRESNIDRSRTVSREASRRYRAKKKEQAAA